LAGNQFHLVELQISLGHGAESYTQKRKKNKGVFHGTTLNSVTLIAYKLLPTAKVVPLGNQIGLSPMDWELVATPDSEPFHRPIQEVLITKIVCPLINTVKCRLDPDIGVPTSVNPAVGSTLLIFQTLFAGTVSTLLTNLT
jgi:hypothetical protein